MIYYSIAALAPILVMELNNQSRRRSGRVLSDKTAILLAILPMALLYGLRYSYVGADTIGYVRSFAEMGSKSWAYCFSGESRHEIGFLIYEKLLSYITGNYTVYFLITGAILFGVLGRFAYKYAGNPYVFLFLFVTLGTYSFYLTGLRQVLAITACLLAFDFVAEKKPIQFALMVVLASFFHKSAICFLVVYPLSNIKNLQILVAVYVGATIAMLLAFPHFNDSINKFLEYEYGIEETGNGQIFLIALTLFAVYSLLNYRAIAQKSTYALQLTHMSLLTVLLWVLRLVSRAMERPSYYFILGLYAFSACAFAHGKWKESRLINFFILFFSFALFAYRNLGVSDYKFFWMG